MTEHELREIEVRHRAATPGPYRWRGNAGGYDLHLRTRDHGGYYVMGFRRWGWSRAEPVFLGAQPVYADGRWQRDEAVVWAPDDADAAYDQRVQQNSSGSQRGYPYTTGRPLTEARQAATAHLGLTPAHHYLRYEVGYRHDIMGIAHPDAIALERSWEDREALLAEVRRLRAALAAVRARVDVLAPAEVQEYAAAALDGTPESEVRRG